jgi:vacuolar-type H+-ATPase subunit C/Vma6
VSSSGFDVVFRYFQVKEFELMNLFYLTEGIRYKMPPEHIRKFMFGLDGIDYPAGRGSV